MASAQILNFIVCDEPVRPRQQAIQCDGCFPWNHQICNSVYRKKFTGQLFEIERKLTGSARCVRIRTSIYADPSTYLESGAPELTFVDPEESQPDSESTRIDSPEESQPDAENQYSTDHEESSLHDPTPAETSSSFAVTYEIVESSSKRGRPKLIDSQGYSYTLQRRRGLVTDWQCSIHRKVNPCRDTLRQRGDQFQCGNQVHNHQAQVGVFKAAKIAAQVEAKAVEDILG
ncbi:hypothetical protein AWC38_SpisGene23408 [Stylophora pistillata]|uniref:FLYWCH-type domain-containing protein n=1 Tax=Stylophora pistillata TaxID=50429 RepID=A0A2B4R4Q0_STYPI|nr:hypothetical protein AWC38_SpisGene23408 [Stylophora pistillata]